MAVATVNLAQLRTQLGPQSQTLLDHAPYQEIITAPQLYDSRAVSFKFFFGYIPEKITKKPQKVWVLLYPPSRIAGPAEVQFHSCDPETGEFAKHDDGNISSTVTEFAPAFKNPKKASKGKHVALAKYYYLEALAALETQSGRANELAIPIPISRTFVDSLKAACREFEEAKAKVLNLALRSPPATLAGDQDSGLSNAPEDLLVQPESVLLSASDITITPEVTTTMIRELNWLDPAAGLTSTGL